MQTNEFLYVFLLVWQISMLLQKRISNSLIFSIKYSWLSCENVVAMFAFIDLISRIRRFAESYWLFVYGSQKVITHFPALFSWLSAKNLGGPKGQKCLPSNCFFLYAKKRLGNTVPMQQTISWSEFAGPRYPQKSSKISCTKPNHPICALFWRISWPHELRSADRLLRWIRVA